MLDCFKAKGYIAGGIITNKRDESLDIAAMPPILRTLLVTDGTVTKTLEAYYWEPLMVEQLGQSEQALEEDVEEMSCHKGDTVLRRNVCIRGVDSGDIYAYATSIIKTQDLPEQISDQLLQGKIGIGELLREMGLETYRQVADIYREIKQEVVPGSSSYYCGELICRTYYIYVGHNPVIQVTEKFPYRLYIKKG
ncbi:chorismate lyase [Hahella sp. KA22]|uniref:chorismate--pyruvate lyase family protein n=1 Tax=Hahella sp. KA22 TaxID=1628392 RepID=UPI000FDE6E48|nr:chorismate lyase [Hahella sp. KA22]AZZ94567.1 chorismate lyase [Hahella sp. KA22]QAY57940.1 chorismate lyase [Hahella sp. KA22]